MSNLYISENGWLMECCDEMDFLIVGLYVINDCIIFKIEII